MMTLEELRREDRRALAIALLLGLAAFAWLVLSLVTMPARGSGGCAECMTPRTLVAPALPPVPATAHITWHNTPDGRCHEDMPCWMERH